MKARLPSASTDASAPAASAGCDLHAAPQLLSVTVRPVPPDTVVLEVIGEVDLSTSPLLENAFVSHLRGAASLVMVDLTGVSFLSATGLTVLVNVKQAAVTAGSVLCLVARTPVVLRPLTITGLDGEFDIYAELADVPPFAGDGPDG